MTDGTFQRRTLKNMVYIHNVFTWVLFISQTIVKVTNADIKLLINIIDACSLYITGG